MITFFGEPEQLPLPFDLPEPQFTRRTLGIMGELATMREFGRAGYSAGKASRGCGDVRLQDRETGEIIYVEVKTSRRGKDGYYRFCLYRCLADRVCTDYRHAQYVVLLAVVAGLTAISFIIPCVDLDQQSITFKDPDKTRKLAAYRRDLGRLENDHGNPAYS